MCSRPCDGSSKLVCMGKKGKREFLQVSRLLEIFKIEDVLAGVGDAIACGAIGFDAVKPLVHPYLPKAKVVTTSVRAYTELLVGVAALPLHRRSYSPTI